MSPAEDALPLLAIVRRHLRTLRFGLDRAYPAEDWGFTAQQALEKLLKAEIVRDDRQAPRSHELDELAGLAGLELKPRLLELQVFAVAARYEEGPFPLPADREVLLNDLEELLERCEAELKDAGS